MTDLPLPSVRITDCFMKITSRTFYYNIILSKWCIYFWRPSAIGDPTMLDAQSSPLHMPTMPRAAPCTIRRSCKTIAPSMQHATCNVPPPWQDNLPWHEEDTKMWKSERRWWKCWNGYVSVETAGPSFFVTPRQLSVRRTSSCHIWQEGGEAGLEHFAIGSVQQIQYYIQRCVKIKWI